MTEEQIKNWNKGIDHKGYPKVIMFEDNTKETVYSPEHQQRVVKEWIDEQKLYAKVEKAVKKVLSTHPNQPNGEEEHGTRPD